jgi:response regulator RpfG family c-di-GMP phosphodiesterase
MENALREEKFVLVVDDEPSIWESLSELLDARGYSVLQGEWSKSAGSTDKNAASPMFGRA